MPTSIFPIPFKTGQEKAGTAKWGQKVQHGIRTLFCYASWQRFDAKYSKIAAPINVPAATEFTNLLKESDVV